MYLQDVFTEERYKEIYSKLQKRELFDYQYFKFGNAKFSIGLRESTFIGEGLWKEGLIVDFDWETKGAGKCWGEEPVEALENFKTYSDACQYIHDNLVSFIKPEDKYQGLRKETQMSIFDFME